METITTFLTVAMGYLLKSAATSKAAQTAKEDLLAAFWNKIKHWFIKDVPEIENKPDDEETAEKMSAKLLELLKDKKFFAELAAEIDKLQKAGIREKNIFTGNIRRVKKIRIGDKEYNPDDKYDRKNIVEGNVKNSDEFNLGDG